MGIVPISIENIIELHLDSEVDLRYTVPTCGRWDLLHSMRALYGDDAIDALDLREERTRNYRLSSRWLRKTTTLVATDPKYPLTEFDSGYGTSRLISIEYDGSVIPIHNGGLFVPLEQDNVDGKFYELLDRILRRPSNQASLVHQ